MYLPLHPRFTLWTCPAERTPLPSGHGPLSAMCDRVRPPADKAVTRPSTPVDTFASGSVIRALVLTRRINVHPNADVYDLFADILARFLAMAHDSVLKTALSLGNTLELACDDACAVAERNRKLAEALEITPSIRPTITWPATLIHQANQNPTLVKSIEKTLETFLSDPTKRTHHFPPSKFNAFISSLVGFYNLTPTFLDTDRKAQSSILVRKTPTSWVPSILLSAASQSKPPTTTASTTTSTAHSNTTHRNTATPTNTPHSTSLTITSLPDGMDTNDIQILLDPLLDSTISTHIHWTTPTDVIVSFSTYPESIERNVRNKFVGNGWAKDVFVSEVKERGKPSGPVVPVPVPVPVPTGNSFGVLCDEEDRGMVERGPTPESWDNED
ncbi:uncharacterized protein SPPG_09347 [Spizellomyces punctatus DAOM BR117]|uniref:R3H domain-containing protein n=1 Tax=Spizellomyces punctatus (strain DAOM BR117) TaxID=645134 RepID=A0A0L0HB13_SPIPD|nr:uncharacterized protein SPPG_09347 [Spizellomyces punctatus DAOM BR117]KNC98402.1 hypothetical protein SPPG_09347 [Spizellomyces punctatus DAOM BR117]|eukprot:XP_016606442.1 hypothetical protein SPPG_09347 [Spizellomyces punctatus DAOM BR117]